MNHTESAQADAPEPKTGAQQVEEFLRLANIGSVHISPKARQLLEDADIEPMVLLWRHAVGDWGLVSKEDREANDHAAATGEERMYSNYPVRNGNFIWIVTEADRSATLFCLPDEYL